MSDGSSEAELDPLTEARRSIAPDVKLCGHCRIWKPTVRDAKGRWIGPCRLQPQRGNLPASAPICNHYLPRDEALPEAPREMPTRRRSRTIGPQVRRGGVTRKADVRPVRPPKPDVEIGELEDMTRNELMEIIREALDEGPMPELAPKWEGGQAVLQPGNDSQPKEIDLDTFFKKVVRIRDQLRVLEQKINGHKTLTDAEKVDLQAYITRCYGSLTTFNALFRHEGDRFRGSSG